MERMDHLWPGGYRFYFDDTLFQPSTDSFLLGSFPKLRRRERVCDLGAGTGLLGRQLFRKRQYTPCHQCGAAGRLSRTLRP